VTAGGGALVEINDNDNVDRRTPKDSKRSAEGRKRGSLASFFLDSRPGSNGSRK
jgi:hypothetical protein